MSLPKPTGIKAPSKISKSATGIGQVKSGIPALGGTKAQRPSSYSRSSTGPEPQPRAPPVDDFIIGDRVWVGGTKPGYIAFLGETQFAPGEWAGVVLDDPSGKNDGSVSGVRYFQCEAKRGVFARISKLSRTEGALSAPAGASRAEGHTNGTMSSLAPRSVTPKFGALSVSRTSSGSTSSLNKPSPPPSSAQLMAHSFKTGDRVLVSGSKPGHLRYIGQTDFAKGTWAGVELDDPMGKNDGAVAGKRYFTCKAMYGLFAPVHKVAKLPANSTPIGMITPKSSRLPGSSSLSGGLRSSRERSGSQESISSISSSASSVSRSRVRLGIGSLSNQAKAAQGGRPSSLNLSATTSALQKALKEKEEHIEQLLRERDLERSEVARAAAQVDEAESQLANTKVEYDRFKDDADDSLKILKARLADVEKEKLELSGKLEDEKRKIEDLQFQIEEESICKDDLEIKTEEDEVRVKQLEVQLNLEKERTERFEQEVNRMKSLLEKVEADSKSSEDVHTMYLDQIEELTHKLSQAENKIKTVETSRNDDNSKSSQLSQQLTEKSQKLTEVEAALDGKKRDLKQMELRLSELEETVKDGQTKNQKFQTTIEDLTSKLSLKDTASTTLNSEIQQLKNKYEDSQRQLEASKAKSDQLNDDKHKLEQQIGDLMKNSGDSVSQLSILNEQLRDKDRKLEEQLVALSNSTQKIAELDSTLENLKIDHDRGVEELINKHKEELKSVQDNRDDVQAEVEKLQSKINQLLEQHNQEKTELESSKQREVTGLKETIQISEEEKHKLKEQLEENTKNMETITTDNENIKFEKEKLERTVKKLEGERDGLREEVSKTQTELEAVKTAQGQLHSEQGSFKEELQTVTAEKEQMIKDKLQLEKKLQESQVDRTKLLERSELLKVENTDLSAHIERQVTQIAKLETDISQLTEQLKKHKEKIKLHEHEAKDLHGQLEEVKSTLSDTQNRLTAAEQDKEGLKAEKSSALKQLNDNKNQFEGTKAQLETSMQELTQRSESESKQSSLQESLNNMSTLLQQTEEELIAKTSQIGSLESEKSNLLSYKSSTEILEAEKTELTKQMAGLERSLQESKATAAFINNPDGEGNPILAELRSEKDSLDGQVQFLNSVIIELQNKNELLSVRLEAMESGTHINGGINNSVESPSKVKAPRLFCDICDVFDKHETEDCPLQAMSDTDASAHSAHHIDKATERAYCDICEVFGHWTNDCDDEQTF